MKTLRKLLASTVLCGAMLLNSAAAIANDQRGMFTFPATFFATSGIVKSLTRFSITIGNGATSNTATISAVDTANSAVFFNMWTTSYTGDAPRLYSPRVSLTNSTTVTASRDTADTATITVRGYVIEFKPSAIASIQQSTVTLPSSTASNTATISSVNTSRSMLLYQGITNTTTTTSPQGVFSNIELTNSTTVTATRANGTTAVVTIGFCVVEFKAGIISSVQSRTATQATSSTTITDTISSVDITRSIILYNGALANTSGIISWLYSIELASATSVSLTRLGTSAVSRTIKYQVVEFAAGILKSNIQRNATVVSGATFADTTVSAVVEDKSSVISAGFKTDGASPNERCSTVTTVNDTTVRAQKNTGTNVSTHAWNLAEWIM